MREKPLKHAIRDTSGRAASGMKTRSCCGSDCCDPMTSGPDGAPPPQAAVDASLDGDSPTVPIGCCDPDCCGPACCAF